MVKVEVLDEIAELRIALPDVRPGVWATVGLGVQALSSEEVVFDECDVSVVAEGLMIDVTLLGIRADDHCRHTETETVLVDDGRHHVVVKPPQSSHDKKMAVLFQSGLFITELINPVTYDCPELTRAGGCSLTGLLGSIQLTAGRVPFFAAV